MTDNSLSYIIFSDGVSKLNQNLEKLGGVLGKASGVAVSGLSKAGTEVKWAGIRTGNAIKATPGKIKANVKAAKGRLGADIRAYKKAAKIASLNRKIARDRAIGNFKANMKDNTSTFTNAFGNAYNKAKEG